MFLRTLRKLTVLNSGVFLVIFISFGLTLYGYVAHQLFKEVDQAMRWKSGAFYLANGRPRLSLSGPVFPDPRVVILLRTTDGNIIAPGPYISEDVTGVIPFIGQFPAETFQTMKLAGHVYRLYNRDYRGEETILSPDNPAGTISQVLAVCNVDPELAMLSRLLSIMILSLAAGMLTITLAGYYLARRALVPITAAWEKQQRFVADASHELRTPLTVITVNTELLLRRPNRTIEQESVRVTTIFREAQRMAKLVATLLTLARADAAQAELNRAPVDFGEIIKTIAGQFEALVAAKRITLTVTVEGPLVLLADKERLHQLGVILLDNAVKYTAPAGKISLSARSQNNQLLFTVQDTGCGIGAEELPHVFDRFYRGDKTRSRETGGMGLGLSIAYWIVAKHGGRIKVQSEAGVGSRFQVSLPLK